jgi:hypothetical protein
MLAGVLLLAAGLYYNPLTAANKLSPISVTTNEVITLNYSAVALNTIMYTNDGDSQIDPHPVKVLQLWEPTIRQTSAMVTVMENSRGEPAGVGVKFSSRSERTNVLDGEALMDSVWHIFMPERGTLFIEQTENYWGFLRGIAIPARLSSGDNWRGTWRGNISHGPGALGTANVTGGAGVLGGVDTVAVEALSAQAYSVEKGPVAVQGELSIEVPRRLTGTIAE